MDVVFDKLAEVCASGLTVIMVEQKASRALAIAHRGYVMHGGRVAYEGEAGSLLANENVKRLFLGRCRRTWSARSTPSPEPDRHAPQSSNPVRLQRSELAVPATSEKFFARKLLPARPTRCFSIWKTPSP